MAGLLNNLFGAKDTAPSAVPSLADDPDFADFAGAPISRPASNPPLAPSEAAAHSAFSATAGGTVPYTKWYRVWERTTPKDFVQEGFILAFIFVVLAFHFWGTRANRKTAKRWIASYAPTLQQEFALVGFEGLVEPPSAEDVEASGLASIAAQGEIVAPERLMKEESGQEFSAYASGRQNVAWVDLKLHLHKRYNPLAMMGEYIVSFFFESYLAPMEKMEARLIPFDGREGQLVPMAGGKSAQDTADQRNKPPVSGYDNFVWAIVNKDIMNHLREDRYDISLTSTKDHPKLPNWVTVMSESAEITDLLLTPELISAVEATSELLDYLIVTDQPLEKPTKPDEAQSRKKIDLCVRIPRSPAADPDPTVPILSYFLRLPDQLVSSAHFRPEVSRKVRQTREDELRKLRKMDEDEKAEERNTKKDKEKKEKRDSMLRTMSADEQRKFLEKEREKDYRKSQKKMTRRG
ncbi:hypothetical protein GP486_004064 [Trichoglossum hirsutum]|uniref:DUF1682-domain-containing protein n=1 Tax=Trichoglossum hirsutum TaxID=265104 RepID=A0A9P8LC20_9PEZI|nr:hypothetical protein GP486_004064 [Trichoglossum hirsutum]